MRVDERGNALSQAGKPGSGKSVLSFGNREAITSDGMSKRGEGGLPFVEDTVSSMKRKSTTFLKESLRYAGTPAHG
jgi:hypothetical protein